jgi:hypothetical protein
MRQALSDPQLLGMALEGDSWRAWRVILIAVRGEPLDDDEREIFRALAGGREYEPTAPATTFAAVIGRRGGKSRAMAVLVAYLSLLVDYSTVLSPGEVGVALTIAPDQRQAAIVLDYARAVIAGSPVLRHHVTNDIADAIELDTGVTIEVRAASFRRLRGPTYICVVGDESAYWHNEYSQNPDAEIIAACRPGLLTTGGPLILISSPHARRGELWEHYRRYFGPAGDPRVLVIQGSSRALNPGLPQDEIERELERDPDKASAEWLAIWRTDVESFVSVEAVNACVELGVRERPPMPGVQYVAHVDPAGGSGADSFTLAIAHRDDDVAVLDAVREFKPPFSPEGVVSELCSLLDRYGIRTVVGDRYASEWPREQFRKRGIEYHVADKSTSELYRDLLPVLNSRQCELLDNPILVSQLTSLERRVGRTGRDSIGHPLGQHDDVANATAGVIVGLVATRSAQPVGWYQWDSWAKRHVFIALTDEVTHYTQ